MKKKVAISILALACVAGFATLVSPALARDDEVLSVEQTTDISDAEYELYDDGELSESIDISNRFNLNSDEVHVDDMDVVILPTLEKEGKTLVYWCSTEDGKGTIYYPGDEYVIGTEPELFAIWDDFVFEGDENYVFDVDFDDFKAEPFSVDKETGILDIVPKFDGYKFVNAYIDDKVVIELKSKSYLIENKNGTTEWIDVDGLVRIKLEYESTKTESKVSSDMDESETVEESTIVSDDAE